MADRVLLGLLPSSEEGWRPALAALKPGGGVMHLHHNVRDADERSWLDSCVSRLSALAHDLVAPTLTSFFSRCLVLRSLPPCAGRGSVRDTVPGGTVISALISGYEANHGSVGLHGVRYSDVGGSHPATISSAIPHSNKLRHLCCCQLVGAGLGVELGVGSARPPEVSGGAVWKGTGGGVGPPVEPGGSVHREETGRCTWPMWRGSSGTHPMCGTLWWTWPCGSLLPALRRLQPIPSPS